MWYVIQTMTGHEEELIKMLDTMLTHAICEKCFFIRREISWRFKGENKIQEQALFPGYVFAETQNPEVLFYQLKKVPKLSKLLSGGEQKFLPVQEDEQKFLESLITLEEDDGKKVYVVKRSEIEVDEKGDIIWAGEPLSQYLENVVRKRIRKRYVVIEKELFGKKRMVLLSVRLKGEE